MLRQALGAQRDLLCRASARRFGFAAGCDNDVDEGRMEGIEGIDGNVSRGEELAHGVQAADEAVGGLTVMAEPLTGGRRDGKSFWR